MLTAAGEECKGIQAGHLKHLLCYLPFTQKLEKHLGRCQILDRLERVTLASTGEVIGMEWLATLPSCL